MFVLVYTEVEGDQWRIQDFLEGAPTPGQLTYTWSNLCRKLHGHEKNRTMNQPKRNFLTFVHLLKAYIKVNDTETC